MAPQERGWVNLFVDRFVGWWSGLPGESCSYTVEKLRIPVGHVHLAANLYHPTIPKPYGTILVRTSCGIGPLMALGHARMFASRGYQVLLAACRGTDPSDGQEVSMGVHEASDGLATVSWMREQSWYTGSFGTSGPHDFGRFIWGTGAMESHAVAWTDLMTSSKRGIIPGPAYIKKQPEILRPVYDSVPLSEGLDKHFQHDTPNFLRLFNTHPDPSDPVYKDLSQHTALQRAKIPILQFTGWKDIGLPSVTEQYKALSERGVSTFMTMGNWSHLGAQRGTTIAEGFKFIEKYLANRGEGFRTSPVRAFFTGSEEWRDLPAWPPSPTSTDELYFGPGGILSRDLPSESTQDSTFRFDPKEPIANIGLPRPFDDMIPANYEDTSLAERSDVVVFTSTPLDSDLEVCGEPTVELHHSSDYPHVDLLIRLSEVDNNGRSNRISDVYKRLDPARESGPLTFKLSACAHKFRRGKRIRVIIAGGAHPAYIRNLGTGENPGLGTSMQAVLHTIHHSANAASSLKLPILSA
ncbi:galactose-binding like protein [Mollisia scopiformis]|uniref:Galactose-binding like protein n=1 Tax=Mollisia scopiformis TaxID=149040 RepID=A0A194XPH3_MOLSC|nr:galactose-binding like protein [Mollisia scopiformis]KUJ21637.1 galactose-binding like protein [Mollisia scopiformis]